jgi:hypothetical protein
MSTWLIPIQGESEMVIGKMNLGPKFVISTKAPTGVAPIAGSKENIAQNAKLSLDALKSDKV